MPEGEIRLAKLSRPRVGKALARERLFSCLDRARERPVVWVAAQPGAGKTTLLASYLDARRIPSIWYQVDAGDDDPASFFHYLALAATDLKRRKAPPLPAFTNAHRADVSGFSRLFFRVLYQHLGRKGALVLDNLHEVGEDRVLHRALATAFDELPVEVGVLVASRTEPPAAYVPLVARDRLSFIQAGEMRLSLEETTEIVGARADLDARSVARLHESSDGWAAAVTLLVERARRGEALDAAPGEAIQQVFEYLAEHLVTVDFADSLDTLLQLSFLPRISPAIAHALTGDAGAGALLERLHRRHLFTQRRDAGARVSYEFHALLRAYLQHKAAQAWPRERRTEVLRRAAALLEGEGDAECAVPMYRELGDWPGLARVCLASAQGLVNQGRSQTLLEWLAAIPEPVKDEDPRLRYWQGSALATLAPGEARAELVRAHAAFVRKGDNLGRLLAATGAILTYYLDLSKLHELDPWIDEVAGLVDCGLAFPTPAIELHVRMAQLFAWDFRRPDPRLLDRCAARMEELLDAPIGDNDRLAAATILLVHNYQRSRVEEARRVVARIEPMLGSAELAPVNRALWWMQVGWFNAFCGDSVAAVKALETASRVRADSALSIPQLDVYIHFGLAFAALLDGDWARAEAHRAATERYAKAFRRMDLAASEMFKGAVASNRGEREAALRHARRHLELALEGGVEWQIFYGCIHCAFAAADLGRREEVADFARQARERVAGSIHERFAYQADFMEAYAALVAGDRDAMRAKLASGLVRSRDDPAKFFMRIRAKLLSRLYAAALEEGIEPDLVRESIRRSRVAPPSPDARDWPWPLEVRTLGRFQVLRDGLPLEFSRKAPRKTLQLLKALIACGGSNVPEQSLLEALWADEEGDAASKSLGAAVLRLRTLLGDADAVVQQAGTLSLERSRAWVDAFAFDSTGRLDLYAGTFLPEEEGAAWAVPLREKLRARFIQRLGDEGRRLEQEGRHEEAIDQYMRGLDADPIIEPFYQGLMRSYVRLDRRAEAAAAYRRLRQILSVTLGIPPSATTEKLFRSLHLAEAQSVGHK
jgi:ATP/maltotriose-dependent transcriptional regulator MalT/DNA-binding SARP family transcriptional activator